MARKNRGAGRRATNARFDESVNRLPQNIVGIGERVEEDKNIYISQPAYKSIHRFTQGKTTNESGGMLIGSIIQEFGKTHIVICGFVEAKFCEATPITLKFTHETWEYCHREIDKKYPGKKIVGWIHTHPGFGIFLSEYDKFIQGNFFKEEYEVAYVVDPVQGVEGFYFWINGRIERCKGFFVYDKTGTKINVGVIDGERAGLKVPQTGVLISRIVIAALLVAVLALLVSVVNLNAKINVLRNQQSTNASIADQNFSYLQQQILSLQDRINELIANAEPDTATYDEDSKTVVPTAQTDVDISDS